MKRHSKIGIVEGGGKEAWKQKRNNLSLEYKNEKNIKTEREIRKYCMHILSFLMNFLKNNIMNSIMYKNFNAYP